MPLATALTVPSPPAAAITSNSGSASRTRRSASRIPRLRRTTAVQPRRSSAATISRRRRSERRNRPAAGLAIIRMRRRDALGGRAVRLAGRGAIDPHPEPQLQHQQGPEPGVVVAPAGAMLVEQPAYVIGAHQT